MEQGEAQQTDSGGVAGVQRGDAAGALAELEGMLASNDPATPWMIVARARSMTGDTAGEEDAMHHQLATEPCHLLALLRMGDIKRSAGDGRAAGAFYKVALSTAAQETQLPPALQPLLLEQAD